MTAPSGTLRRPCSRSTLKCRSTSPSSSSLTRNPKPRVASNHFTRPVTGGSSASAGSIIRLDDGPCLPRPDSANALTMSPQYHARSVGKPTLRVRSRPSARRARRCRLPAPGGMSTIVRARANAWPARTMAAIAFLALLRVGGGARRTDRSFAAAQIERRSTARASAWSRAARRPLRRRRLREASRRAGACRSRGCSAPATWRAHKQHRRHSRARRNARRARSRSGSRSPSQPRSRSLRAR